MQEEQEAEEEREREEAARKSMMEEGGGNPALDESQRDAIRDFNDRFSNDPTAGYERLADAVEKAREINTDTDLDASAKRKNFGRQRSLSLTPKTNKSIKISVSPHKSLTRSRSWTDKTQTPETVMEYTEEDLKKYLKPISTEAAKKKFAYLDII